MITITTDFEVPQSALPAMPALMANIVADFNPIKCGLRCGTLSTLLHLVISSDGLPFTAVDTMAIARQISEAAK